MHKQQSEHFCTAKIEQPFLIRTLTFDQNAIKSFLRNVVEIILEFAFRWHELQKRSNDRRDLLDKKLRHFQAVEDKFLLFAKKASSFNSWFENAEEDLSDPVKCNSIDEIKASNNSRGFKIQENAVIFFSTGSKTGRTRDEILA